MDIKRAFIMNQCFSSIFSSHNSRTRTLYTEASLVHEIYYICSCYICSIRDLRPNTDPRLIARAHNNRYEPVRSSINEPAGESKATR
jgi:hypothetical protein